MNEKTVPELPENWVWTRLGVMIDKVPLTGKKLKQKEYQTEGKFPVVDQGQAFIGGYTNREDVLICCDSPVIVFGDHTKVVKYVDFDFVAGADGIKVIKPHVAFYPKLFFHFVQAVELPNKGYARHFQFLEKSRLPLSPLAEQRRIVTKIEELFTQLDAGVGALTKAKSQLKRYRQSVLKSACEGRLVPTEAELARADGRDYEPADVLLARIQKERREKWEVEKRRKGRKSAKYKEPTAPDVSGLPELPEGWCWVNVDSFTVFGPQNGLYLPKSAYGVGVSIIRIDDFQDDSSRSAHELHQVNADQNDIWKYNLMKNDLVINRVNSPTHLGKCLVVAERNLPSIFESNMMRLRLSAFVDPFFVGFYLRSVSGKKRLISNAKWAVNQASINQKDVVSTPVPLPLFPEQHRIVAEIERRLSVADEIEKTIDQCLKQAERLRQSILKRAFEGKLVPQDPNDEPASVLLEQILLQKEINEKNNKPKRRKNRGQKTR